MRVSVLASGRGSDFQSIIDGISKKEIDAEVVLLISDDPKAKAIERARKNDIPYKVISVSAHTNRLDHDRAIKEALDDAGVDLVVLAGYMRIIKDKKFLDEYCGKMINIHPSLLPSFPGAHAQKDAFERGVKISGYTIHFVDNSLDGGAIIHQEAVDIADCKSADEVASRILEREHVGLPKIVNSFSKGRYVVLGKRTEYAPNKRS
ncbi:MAG: phosphoribosylglycinamide formyltransferase [Candidatus Micrarchaeota archaeon]